ncbi:hypothetical protein M885DRAFT_505737 [Pelagophyceae sp. CCMP2097]|nr:hypothetical protein M885DRAFT_505737 [Pelagophyceae sp. CCMP2097]|mmetsp:Transcript_6063/g.19374  ORF Transcript_6063/g.19374 Transcript_6063/m.19374 type:complete len:299 (-) Transcript_6063:40-936(-)
MLRGFGDAVEAEPDVPADDYGFVTVDAGDASVDARDESAEAGAFDGGAVFARDLDAKHDAVVFSTDLAEAERLASMLRRDGWRSARAEQLHFDRLRDPEPLAIDDDAVALLLHAVEGRTLLVDKDGLYNAWIVAAIEKTRGSVVVALSSVPTEQGRVASDDVVSELVDSGQASVWAIHRRGRFLTWDVEPCPTQLLHLRALRDAQFEPLTATPDMALNARTEQQKQAALRAEQVERVRGHVKKTAQLTKLVGARLVDRTMSLFTGLRHSPVDELCDGLARPDLPALGLKTSAAEEALP